MQCAACELELSGDDNYCRRCGAAVRVVAVQSVPEARSVVRVGPSTPTLFASAVRPLAAGMAVVAAGAIARAAVRSAARGLMRGAVGSRRPISQEIRPRSALRGRSGHTIELYIYRRSLPDD